MSRLPIMDTALWLNAGTRARYPLRQYPVPRLFYEAVCRREGGAACEAWAGTLYVQKLADAASAIRQAMAAAPAQWAATWPHMAKLVGELEAAADGRAPLPAKKSLEAALVLAASHPVYAARTLAAASRLGLIPSAAVPAGTAQAAASGAVSPAALLKSAAVSAAGGAAAVLASMVSPPPGGALPLAPSAPAAAGEGSAGSIVLVLAAVAALLLLRR